ncbi:(S)-mandelate dehydrogenase [Bradyrhizobium erythrophlei]|jgi:(S)-mandelate dehydrogenase|nr:(S)-mandelate dehydrogenase [Bradyrhizobium erythrophlei]
MARRRLYRGSDFRKALSIAELREIAKRRLPAFSLEFLESGGEDEVTLGWNRDVFKSLRFVPKTLVNTSSCNIDAVHCSTKFASPLIIGPSGHNNIMRSDGDRHLASAAAAAGIPYTLATLSNTRLEDLAEHYPGKLWMQLYVFKDRALTDDIINRADDAGYDALVFTTDANVFGWREWDRRRFRAPGKLSYGNMLDAFMHPRWFWDVMIPNGVPPIPNVTHFFPEDARDTKSAITIIPSLFAPTIDWTTVEDLRARWKRKLIIKGILSVEDACKAADAGCDGIVLSNHGGRHLDTCISPMEILPEVAERVGNRLSIIVDSGFRRGSDVVKAIALGAHAVMIGRAALYGLAAGGQEGVAHALRLLNDEIKRVLGMIGCPSLSQLDKSFIRSSASFEGPASLGDL